MAVSTACPKSSAAARATSSAPKANSTQALNAAWKERSGPSILQVIIDPNDCSRALSRLAERMSKTVVQKFEGALASSNERYGNALKQLAE